MKNEMEDILSTQSESEKTHNSESLYKQEKIENTPFTLIWLHNKGWFTAMGTHRITEATETKEEQLQLLETNKWEIMLHLAIIVAEKYKDFEKLKEVVN